MVTIRNVRVLITAPNKVNLVAVKVETSEAGLYGWGCATFTQRCFAVKAFIEEHLAPLLIGRDVSRIEDLWQLMMVHGYWRNGPVGNNAISGIDMALWDIQGKMAGMPLYQMFGGKVRGGAAVYTHATGSSSGELVEKVKRFTEAGVRHVRVQLGGASGFPYGGDEGTPRRPEGALDGAYYDARKYARDSLKMMEEVRVGVGDGVELVHDVHERMKPAEAVEFAKACEEFRLFFLEDALAPEDAGWFENIRRVCATPLAVGELFVNPSEWTPLVAGRLIDFARMHVSAIGGITPARKVSALCEAFGVRMAWHGPPDVTGMGHAANVHLDLSTVNFGIQEWGPGGDVLKPESGLLGAVYEVFPGMPELREGYLYVSEKPGLGVEVNEEAAGRYPALHVVQAWTQARGVDGGVVRP